MSHKLSRFLIGRGACGYCMHRSLEFNDKDAVFSFNAEQSNRKAIISMILRNEKGTILRYF